MTAYLRRAGFALLAPVIAVLIAMLTTSVVIALTNSGSGVNDFWRIILTKPDNRIIVNIVNQTGMIYLSAVALLPEFLMTGFKVAPIPFIGERLDAVLPTWFTQGMGVTFYFGGTTLLIVVGVAMDTVQQVESQLIMRHYDGFMKKTRIRGRRA